MSVHWGGRGAGHVSRWSASTTGVPALVLDFLTTTSLDSRVTFTRALDTATLVNSSGLVEIVNANVPRFDYNPTTLAPRGLLIEETRTNLLLNSVFAGAVSGTPGTPPTSWSYSSSGGTSTVASLGYGFAANSVRFAATATRHFVNQAITVSALSTYTISMNVTVNVATTLQNFLAFSPTPAGATIQYVYNNVNQAASYTPPLGNGTLKAIVTVGATGGSLGVRIGAGVSFTATSDITIQNIQAELGAFSTSYIPTTTTSLTRNADVATMTGTNFSSWYNQSEGTFVANGSSAQAGAFNVLFEVKDATSAERFGQGIGASGSTFYVIDNNATQAAINAGTVSENAVAKLGSAYKVNDFAAVLNGGTVGTDVSGTLPTVDRMLLGNSASNIYLNGHIRQISYYNTRLLNTQLQTLTQ